MNQNVRKLPGEDQDRWGVCWSFLATLGIVGFLWLAIVSGIYFLWADFSK